jgi:undecaprenyl-diphosphatase
MLETLVEIDRSLFLFMNVSLANPVTDFIMPIVTSDHLLRVCYVVAMLLILWRGDARMRWLVLVSAIVLAGTDQLSAGLLKPMIGRLRPCHVMENINLLVGCGGGKAMPSSHAANAFGQAVLFALLYVRVRWWLIGIATLIALSRISVGVHYPADVMAGALLGTLVAVALAFIFERVMDKPRTDLQGKS